jgi:hypothetical protein
MTHGLNQRLLLVVCFGLLVFVGPAAQSAGTGREARLPPEQKLARPPDEILRSAKGSDFTTVLRDILSVAGQPDIAIQLRPSADTKTTAASVEGGRKTIEYNAKFISELAQLAQTNWAVVLVLAHEVAHLLGGHASPTLRSPAELRRLELEADHSAGFLLARLGASLLESSRSLKAACQLEVTNETDCAAYEDAVKVGWQAGAKPANRRLQLSGWERQNE